MEGQPKPFGPEDLDAAVMQIVSGSKVQAPKHPGMLEWLRARRGEPLVHGSPGNMPLAVAEVYLYLMGKYGYLKLTPDRSQHNRMVDMEWGRIQEFNERSGLK